MREKLRNPNSLAREFAVQFLYQCEREKIAYFPEGNFLSFVNHFAVPDDARSYTRVLVEGTLENLAALDEKIASISKNWSISRMGAIDRCVLRMATYELSNPDVPRKVTINEAIEIAKRFGSENSGAFVNGILDQLEGSVPLTVPS